jgi:hypothetical protein
MKSTLTEQIQLPHCKIVGDFFLDVENGVLDIEPDDLTSGQFDQREMRKHGETLEDKLMLVVVDNGGGLDQEIRRRGDRDPVMVELVGVVTFWNALFQVLLSWIYPVPDPGLSGFDRASAQRTVVHLAWIVVPHFRVESIRVLLLPLQFFHGAVFFVGQLFFGASGGTRFFG